jgi:hypothetical protein
MTALSKESIDAVRDLIENKLSIMQIGDRDDLRERVALERALSELIGPDEVRDSLIRTFGEIPRRGRRRKVAAMLALNEEDERAQA